MDIAVDDAYVESYIRNLQIQERQREVALRTQTHFRVFVSYSHADHAVAEQITKRLDQRNIRYFVDEKSLAWGDRISDEVRKAIEDCTDYLLILSENSMASQWCAFEYGIASGNNKNTLIYLARGGLVVPPFASNSLATSDMQEIETRFSIDLIDIAAVDRFIVKILDDRTARLEEFQSAPEGTEGREAWDAPDRQAIEQARASQLEAYIQDYGTQREKSQLFRIEFEDEPLQKCVLLHYKSPGYPPERYELSYSPELIAVVVQPRMEQSEAVGVRDGTPSGDVHFCRRAPSVEDQLHNRPVYGWEASRDFWEVTLHRLLARLPAKTHSTTT
jgi:hypothetical protein